MRLQLRQLQDAQAKLDEVERDMKAAKADQSQFASYTLTKTAKEQKWLILCITAPSDGLFSACKRSKVDARQARQDGGGDGDGSLSTAAVRSPPSRTGTSESSTSSQGPLTRAEQRSRAP